MANNFGVFVRSSQSDVAIIDKCNELLQSFQSDGKIRGVFRDQVHNGLNVFLDGESGVDELLKKKFLSDRDHSSTIHPLTTALCVHQASPNNEEEFKEAIRDQIWSSISVKVLDITKIPISPKYPTIGSGRWIIILNIPEIEELDEFKKMGLPNNMVLKYPTNDDYLRVEFHCRLCQKDGHVQHRCMCSDTSHSSSPIHSSLNDTRLDESIHSLKPKGLFTKNSVPLSITSKISKQEVDLSSTPSPPKNSSEFRIRDRTEEKAEPLPTPTEFPQDVEAFATSLGREEVRRSLFAYDSVKIEIDEQIPSPLARPKDHFSNSYAGEASNATASSTTTEKDSLEIIFESNPSFRQGCIQTPPENSPVVTTTNHQPPTTKREASFSDEDSKPPIEKRLKKTLRILPVVIPDGIREIISSMPDGVLNIWQLEAFFNHVKKKSRPSEIAAQYSSDVEGLHAQLDAISREYYSRPKVGSKEDIQFMKMLGNVMKRFYNVPVLRRVPTH